MNLFASTSKTDTLIKEVYAAYKKEILHLSDSGNAEACMTKVFDVWMFMNRFRNCDLQFYFDEELHEAIAKLNPQHFDVSGLLKKKNKFRIAFIIGGMVDTGGASIPHRFMLEKYKASGITFQQYVLISNISNKTEYKNTESYRYLHDEFCLNGFEHLPSGMGWLEKGKYIEQWLFKNEIDFVVVDPCPATIYALASKPTVISAVMSQDCYTFTLGPGTGDFTFLVTTDQAFKYKLSGDNPEEKMKIVMLPLHNGDYIANTEALSNTELGVPESAIISGSTNMWKTCFGDTEVLLEGIAILIRRHPNYHHVFAGTPRCLDNLEVFLSKNEDVRNNIHYLGPVKNIYRFLKAIDFWVNSFPTSGGSDIECALLGKPTIEFLANRNLDLHGAEFLCSGECDVISMSEFVTLGTRFITEPSYRNNLGEFLKNKIGREFDKERIVKERIYDFFVDEFNRRLDNCPSLPSLKIDDTIEYEKRIALFNVYGRMHWTKDEKMIFLEACRKEFPYRSFAWIKSLEEAIIYLDLSWFEEVACELNEPLLKDYRVHVMLALGKNKFGETKLAISHAKQAIKLACYDEIPARIAAQILVENNMMDEAAKVYPVYNGKHVATENIEQIFEQIGKDNLPLYYDY